MDEQSPQKLPMREGYVFYRSFYEAVKNLPPKEFKECITAITEYALNGEEMKVSPVAGMFLAMAKPQIDANNKRYENGRKGGRPKKDHVVVDTPDWFKKGKQNKEANNEVDEELIEEIERMKHAVKPC